MLIYISYQIYMHTKHPRIVSSVKSFPRSIEDKRSVEKCLVPMVKVVAGICKFPVGFLVIDSDIGLDISCIVPSTIACT